MTESVYCGICRCKVPLDSDHVELDAETVRIDDRDDQETYVFHEDCWYSLSEGWMDPA